MMYEMSVKFAVSDFIGVWYKKRNQKRKKEISK